MTRKTWPIIFTCCIFLFVSACASNPIKVEVKQERDLFLDCKGLKDEIVRAEQFKKDARSEDRFMLKHMMILSAMISAYNMNSAENRAIERIAHLQALYNQKQCHLQPQTATSNPSFTPPSASYYGGYDTPSSQQPTQAYPSYPSMQPQPSPNMPQGYNQEDPMFGDMPPYGFSDDLNANPTQPMQPSEQPYYGQAPNPFLNQQAPNLVPENTYNTTSTRRRPVLNQQAVPNQPTQATPYTNMGEDMPWTQPQYQPTPSTTEQAPTNPMPYFDRNSALPPYPTPDMF